jgi:mannobiose 2-epimerase
LLRKQLAGLVKVFTERLLMLKLRTSISSLMKSEPESAIVSYGHDIEASWLLCEAADVLWESEKLTMQMKAVSRFWKHSRYCTQDCLCCLSGLADDGSLLYERMMLQVISIATGTGGCSRSGCGLLYAWQLSVTPAGLEMASDAFSSFGRTLSTMWNGEWFWSIRADGTFNLV